MGIGSTQADTTDLEKAMTTAPTKTMNGKSIMPSLTVDDLDRSLSFFTGLGFEVERTAGNRTASCSA